MKKITVLILMVHWGFCFGQGSFQKVLSSSNFTFNICSTVVGNDNNLTVIGELDDSLNGFLVGLFVAKLDSAGNPVSLIAIDSIQGIGSNLISLNNNEGHLIFYNASGNFILRVDSSGIPIWFDSLFVGNSILRVRQAIALSNNDIFILGDKSFAGQQARLLKIDVNGGVAWGKRILTSNIDSLRSLTLFQNKSEQPIVSFHKSRPPFYDGYIALFDTSGNVIWSKSTSAYNTYLHITNLGCDADNNIYAMSGAYFGGHDYNCLMKIDSLGNLLWAKKFLLEDSPQALSFKVLNNKVNIFFAALDSTSFYFQNETVVFDTAGNFISRLALDSTSWINGFRHGVNPLSVLSDESLVFSTNPNQGSHYTPLLQKTDSLYNLSCNFSNLPLFVDTIAIALNPAFITTDTVTAFAHSTYHTFISLSSSVVDYCQFVSIYDTTQNSNSFSIFPNPTVNTFTVRNISSTETTLMQIINPLGEIIHTEKLFGKNEYLIDADFAKGIYFVRVTDGEKNIVRKLVIE